MSSPSPKMTGDASFAINRLLDALPRTRIFRRSCERPAFRAMGVAGYHAALVATLGTGLVAGRSLLVLAAVAAVCAISFFAWAYLRRAITGRERLVLLEHVWVAELASAGTLRLLHEPLLPYLDAVSVGLAVFLAWGRAGCLLAGCCHGHPASVGVRYGEEAARDGFPQHLVGVRLFPVQALEALGLLGIALVGFAFVSGPVEGRALTWFLASYAVMRFGLEGLRADDRPHVLGLSQSRWMAIAELAAAIALGERDATIGPGKIAAAGILLAVLVASICIVWILQPRRRLMRATHLAELRALARTLLERAPASGSEPVPEIGRTSRWVSLGVSRLEDGRAHFSICLPAERSDLRLLCDVVAGALPELEPLTGRTTPRTLLHFRAPLPLADVAPRAAPGVAHALYGSALRHPDLDDDAPRTAKVPQIADAPPDDASQPFGTIPMYPPGHDARRRSSGPAS